MYKRQDLLITINKEDYLAAKKFKAKRVALINGIGIDINKFKKIETEYLREKYNLSLSLIHILPGPPGSVR